MGSGTAFFEAKDLASARQKKGPHSNFERGPEPFFEADLAGESDEEVHIRLVVIVQHGGNTADFNPVDQLFFGNPHDIH